MASACGVARAAAPGVAISVGAAIGPGRQRGHAVGRLGLHMRMLSLPRELTHGGFDEVIALLNGPLSPVRLSACMVMSGNIGWKVSV